MLCPAICTTVVHDISQLWSGISRKSYSTSKVTLKTRSIPQLVSITGETRYEIGSRQLGLMLFPHGIPYSGRRKYTRRCSICSLKLKSQRVAVSFFSSPRPDWRECRTKALLHNSFANCFPSPSSYSTGNREWLCLGIVRWIIVAEGLASCATSGIGVWGPISQTVVH